jgi:hypothetical protein
LKKYVLFYKTTSPEIASAQIRAATATAAARGTMYDETRRLDQQIG